MMLLDYDEFNIYTTIEDVEIYVESLINQGFEIQEEIYSKCLNHFGGDFRPIIDKFFTDEN